MSTFWDRKTSYSLTRQHCNSCDCDSHDKIRAPRLDLHTHVKGLVEENCDAMNGVISNPCVSEGLKTKTRELALSDEICSTFVNIKNIS